MHTMENTIQKAENAYREKEMLKSQIEQMKEEAEDDQKKFLQEYEELERLIDKDRQVLEFIKA